MEKIVEMNNIHKQFPFVKAVDGARFDLCKGEVHSLIGENGAGKSTMMKILYGMYGIDEGEIIVNGKRVTEHRYTTHDAIALGIGMVHQEFMLVEEMTVLENIILGSEPTKAGSRKQVIDFDTARAQIQHYINNYQMAVQLDKKITNISVGEMQRVEIIKALYRGADILILDEPTAVLTPQESDKLFEILEVMKKDGKTIVFISHKLKEVMKISDRISVMRSSKYITTVNKNESSIPELAKLMVGREVFFNIKRAPAREGEIMLDVKDIFVPSERELSKIKGVSFQVKKGEVLGVAGVDGNGQSELGEAIAGLRRVEKGCITLDGHNITNRRPLKIREEGLAHIPEDRNDRGLNKTHTFADNMLAAEIRTRPYSRFGILNLKKIMEEARARSDKFDIRPRDPANIAGSLSGGNAQKIVVARELGAPGKKFLIAAQPTRGIDIGNIEGIREMINDAKAEGVAVLLISADLDEILSLSDRIIVLYEGQITGELINDGNIDEGELGLLMMGGTNKGVTE